MEILNAFPTPIGIKYYNKIDVKEKTNKFFEEIVSEQNSKKTSYNILDREGETVKKIYNIMKKDVNEYAEKIKANCEFDVDSSWIFINEKLKPHQHSICPIVSCFYLSANEKEDEENENIGTLNFIDPRGAVNLFIREKTTNHASGKGGANYFLGSSNMSIVPKTGMMIIFPGYLTHYVDQNISNKDRILVGANWERSFEFDKMDKSIQRTPKGTPLDVSNYPINSTGLHDYITKRLNKKE
jgi:hypothetical protein